MISAEMLVSNLIGGLIGLTIGWMLYRQASRETDEWFTILARFLDQFARVAIPDSNPIEVGFSRDSKGRITNANVTVHVGQAVEHGDAGSVTPVKDPKPDDKDQNDQ